ncbi:hypothetical protein C5S53_07560 [Methanophagales archaeon]|jgi:hypothetical protein|nr:hypothetical protein C5S53_07560 [Methanophagales archaeon]
MSTEDWEEAARCFYNQNWKRLIEINESSKAMLEKNVKQGKLVAMIHVPVGRAKNI